jgi:large-conductance mechanosensitive channel
MTIALQCHFFCEIVMRILNLKQHNADFGRVRMTLNIHQKIVLSLILFTVVISMYDDIFHLLISVLHGVFEWVEHILDIGIENLLETGTHETQVIVFYILVTLIFLGLYRLYRFFPRWYNNLKKSLHLQKIETLSQWQALSLSKKFEWWLFFIVFFSCLLFFSF